MRALPLLIVLLACGGPGFAGSYFGGVELSGWCEDGTAINSNQNEIWTVQETWGRLTVTRNGPCGALAGRVDGSLATLDAKACGMRIVDTKAVTESIWSGEVGITTTEGVSLFAWADGYVSGSASPHCRETYRGNLERIRR